MKIFRRIVVVLIIIYFIVEFNPNIFETRPRDIQQATARRNFELIEEFIEENGASIVDSRDVTGIRPLIIATRNKDLEMIEFLLEKGANPNLGNISGKNPLHIASANGNLEILKLLIESGGNIKGGDTRGRIPIIYSIEHNNIEISKYFIEEKGLDVNTTNREDIPLVKLALTDNDIEFFEWLVKEGARVDPRASEDWDLLSKVINRKRYDLIKILAKEGDIDLNRRGIEGRWYNDFTPLTYATNSNNMELFEILLELGVDLDVKDGRNNTPLKNAILNENDDSLVIFEKLVKSGARINPEKYRNNSWNPLYWALNQGYFDIAEFLVEEGNETLDDRAVRHRNFDYTYLGYAIAQRNVEKTEFLINLGADLNKTNSINTTPLEIANNIYPHPASPEIFKLLVKAGANLDKNENRWHPLIYIRRSGYYDILELLVERDIDLDALVFRKPGIHIRTTGILRGITSRDTEFVKAMVEAGADVNKSANGNRPLELAKEVYNVDEIEQILIENGAF